jgi:hypothetical protein
MVTDDVPAPGKVVVSRSNGPMTGQGRTTQAGALSRRDAGEAVPFLALVPERWQGSVVVWVHPTGKASMFTESGAPIDPVNRLLRAGDAVISADLFMTGEFAANGRAVVSSESGNYEKQTYGGFYYG